MPWSFPGISYPTELVYTQSLGFMADTATAQCLPQVGAFPASGTLTLVWGATTITLPDCVVDTATVRLTADGRGMVLSIKDRRERWSRVAPISGEYNVSRAGSLWSVGQKTLRQLGTILMTALGEGSADVSALPTNVYPPVSWDCDSVIEAAETLFSQFGYSVALGFGAEAVKVVQLGTGATLSSTDQFVYSDTIDAKLVPRYVMTCYGASLMQVRLKLEAVGKDEDGSWKPIGDLSYEPGVGWGKTAPVSMAELRPPLDTRINQLQAAGFVRRAYRVMGFADGTWTIPYAGGTIPELSYILPLTGHLLTVEDIREGDSREPYKVYGKYQFEIPQKGFPDNPIIEITDIDDQVVGRSHWLDRENGILFFQEPIYYVQSDAYVPAELYLETAIRIKDTTTLAWRRYSPSVQVAPSGYGYLTLHQPDQQAETIVTYDSTHTVTGATDNAVSLDATASALATAAAGEYATTASQYKVYSMPKLTLRCDGAIQQVQHILTCGNQEHAVNRTSASRFMEFDKGIPSRAVRRAHLAGVNLGGNELRRRVRESRGRGLEDA